MSPGLARSAGVIAVATMASRVLGLVRDQLLAYLFGAADAMDAFRIAFRLPNVLRDLFAEGAMSAALVPTFTRALAQDGTDRVWRLASTLINILVIISGLVVFLGGKRPFVPRNLEVTQLLPHRRNVRMRAVFAHDDATGQAQANGA